MAKYPEKYPTIKSWQMQYPFQYPFHMKLLEMSSQIIEAGRITIPKNVREKLKLKLGDYVRVEGLTKLELKEVE